MNDAITLKMRRYIITSDRRFNHAYGAPPVAAGHTYAINVELTR